MHHLLLGCSIIQQERLSRITQLANGMSLNDHVPSMPKIDDEMNNNEESPETESFDDWMNSAIPLDSAIARTAVAAGITPDDETSTSSLKIWEPQSPESASASEAPDFIQVRYLDKDDRKDSQCFDDCGSSETSERIYGSHTNGHTSRESLGSSESLFRW